MVESPVKPASPKDRLYQAVTPIWNRERGSRLATIRMSRNWEQSTLAELLGLTQAALSRLESGSVRTNPKFNLARLSAIFPTELSYILNGTGSEKYNAASIKKRFFETRLKTCGRWAKRIKG